MTFLCQSLISRGDYIAVQGGRLILSPRSGKQVPTTWLNKNEAKLVSEISVLLARSVYQFDSYKTGCFFSGRAPGVLFRFYNLNSGTDAFAIFNANLKRQKTSKNAKQGDLLPTGHFTAGKRSALAKLWLRCQLDFPRRPSEWHKVMHRLKPIYLVGNTINGDKLNNSSLSPLNVGYEELIRIIEDKSVAHQGQFSGNFVANDCGKPLGQGLVASNGGKPFGKELASLGLERDLNCVSAEVSAIESKGDKSACVSKHVLSSQVMTCKVFPIGNSKKLPQEQTTDEWLSDYDSAS